jgi:dihydroorotase
VNSPARGFRAHVDRGDDGPVTSLATRVLTGGRVVDPASRTDRIADVVVAGDSILEVGAGAAALHPGAEVVDCTGLLVTPGLIDMHVHVMAGLGDFCVEPDEVGVGMGVPVVVDGGTSGVATFDISRRAVIDHPGTATRVLAFLDPNQLYLATRDFICHKLEIANDIRNLDEHALAASFERNADVVVGCKARACHTGDPEHSPFLEAAQRAAGDKPVMVHLGRFPHTPVIASPALLRQLRPGDIVTHAFRGAGGMLGADGKAIPEFRDAVDRGVVLDVGHSGTDFRFREARRLLDQGYRPDTASTDLNVFNIGGPVFSLVETLTKMLALDLDLVDVIAMGTVNTARAIGRLDELGSLAPGRVAEVSVLRLRTDGPFPVSDGHETVQSPSALEAVGCLRAGEWFPTPALSSFAGSGRTWDDAPDDVDW